MMTFSYCFICYVLHVSGLCRRVLTSIAVSVELIGTGDSQKNVTMNKREYYLFSMVLLYNRNVVLMLYKNSAVAGK
jgi:hypothetical protein